MTITPVTPQIAENVKIVTGGDALQVFPAGIAGGIITNPASAALSLFVNPVGTATLAANDTTFELLPGQSWYAIPGQDSPTTANSADDDHNFTAVFWTEVA